MKKQAGLSLLKSIFLFGLILSNLSCSMNMLSASAKIDTDEARLFQAKMLMNKSKWDDAITQITGMTTAGQAQRDVKATLASAYAGKCGLNLITFADQLSSSSSNLFALFLNTMKSATATEVTACEAAVTLLTSISSSAAARTADENILLAFTSFAKIGAILAVYADTNNDGSADGGFDSCSTAQLPDASLRSIGTGVTIAVASLTASGGNIGSALSTAVNSACSSLAGVDPTWDFCAVTDPTAFSAVQVKAIGGMVTSTDNPGLGTCNNTLANCVCP